MEIHGILGKCINWGILGMWNIYMSKNEPDLGDTRDIIHLILLLYMWNIGVLGNIGYRN